MNIGTVVKIMSAMRKSYIQKPAFSSQRGATTVEYAVILVAIVLAVAGTVIYMASDEDSLMPRTFNLVSNRVGNFDLVNVINN
jgi:uncharacterized protein (UPF0333 family)